MGAIRHIAALLVTAATAYGALDGDPDAPYPGYTGHTWLDTTNDGVISLRNHDDGLSAQVRAGGGAPDDRFRFAAAWDLDTDSPSLRRCDTLLAVAGEQVYPGVTAMGGCRLEGDLGGEDVQRQAHRWFGDQTYGWRYHGSLRVEPVMELVVSPDPRRWPLRPRFVGYTSPDCCQADAQVVADIGSHLRLECGYVLSAGAHVPQAREPVVARADDQRAVAHGGVSVQLGHIGYGLEWGQRECLGRFGAVF